MPIEERIELACNECIADFGFPTICYLSSDLYQELVARSAKRPAPGPVANTIRTYGSPVNTFEIKEDTSLPANTIRLIDSTKP